MKAWLLRLWHRFTLGSTAHKIALYPKNFAGYDCLATLYDDAARGIIPYTYSATYCRRRAADLKPGEIRIVIEADDA